MSENKQANENRETVADILAEMRKESARADLEQYYTLDDAAESMREFAGRLEAAWKREKAEWEAAACAFVSDAVMSGKVAVEHAPVGNAAAMREALLEIETVAGEAVENGTMELPQYSKIVDVADYALSAPARNCDRPECATSKDAQNVWRKEDGGKTPCYEWLLAPAEKGGAE